MYYNIAIQNICTRYRAFYGSTCHWIDYGTLERKSALISCKRVKGSHTYEVVASTMDSVHKQFAIQNKIAATTTDNGSNFVKALRFVVIFFLL